MFDISIWNERNLLDRFAVGPSIAVVEDILSNVLVAMSKEMRQNFLVFDFGARILRGSYRWALAAPIQVARGKDPW